MKFKIFFFRKNSVLHIFMNMIDDNGNCPYTAEEIFNAGVEYAFKVSINWLKDKMDLEHDYPSSNEELIQDYSKLYLL